VRKLVCVAALTAAALIVDDPGVAREGRGSPSGPFGLVTIPSLGSVLWTATCSDVKGVSYALRYREGDNATTEVIFRAGLVSRYRTIQPGQTLRFLYFTARVEQRIEMIQSTKPGVLRARVIVDFTRPKRGLANCWNYAPPSFSVRFVRR
jgi:hypothetical protein